MVKIPPICRQYCGYFHHVPMKSPLNHMKFIEILVHHELPIRNHTMKSPFLFQLGFPIRSGEKPSTAAGFRTSPRHGRQLLHRLRPQQPRCGVVRGRRDRQKRGVNGAELLRHPKCRDARERMEKNWDLIIKSQDFTWI